MTTNQMETLLPLIDQVTTKSDRWLFIGSLIVLGIFALMVMKYFVKQHERLIDDNGRARESYQSAMRAMVDDNHKTARDLAVVIARNSEALDHCTTELKNCRQTRP